MMNVQVVSHETLKPTLSTPEHLRYLQISLLDQLNSPFFVPTIYFFNRPNNETLVETHALIQKLKTAFSQTLSIYYPLAGRLHNADYVTCNDEGVPYLHAEVGSTRLSDIVRKAQISDVDALLPLSNQKGDFPRLLLAIQINTFSCGGIAIGVKSNHRITDGFSLLMFLNAWADITNGKDPSLLPRPYFDTAKLFPPLYNPIDVLDDPSPHLLMDKPVAKWFMFSSEKVVTLRSNLYTSKYIKSAPSLITVLSAFIWSRIILSCRNDIKPYEAFFPVNIRPKVRNPCKDSFYYGNMLVNAIVKPSCTLNNDESLCYDFIEKVRHSVKSIINGDKFIQEMKEGKKDMRFVTDQFDRVKKGIITALGFSNVPSLPVSEPDFGWGNPVWAVTGTMIDGLILISRAGPYSKDFIATINMNKADMCKLEADQVFNSFVFKKANLANISKL